MLSTHVSPLFRVVSEILYILVRCKVLNLIGEAL